MQHDVLAAWCRRTAQELSDDDRTLADAHFDELLGDDISVALDKPVAEFLPQWADYLHRASAGLPPSWGGEVLIIVPLAYTSRPLVEVPPLGDLRTEEFEPPTLYVIDAAHDLTEHADTEVYRHTVIDSEQLRGVRVELVSRRTAQQRRVGWDFRNSLWMRLADAT